MGEGWRALAGFGEAASAGGSGRRRSASQPGETQSGRPGPAAKARAVGSSARSGAEGGGRATCAWGFGLGRAGRNSAGRAAQPPGSSISPDSPRQPQFWGPRLAGRGRSRRVARPGMRPQHFPTATARAEAEVSPAPGDRGWEGSVRIAAYRLRSKGLDVSVRSRRRPARAGGGHPFPG
ncbi:Trinucleotide Repeat-Containing 6B Protein [Manis pentadactyla]|nr:Trinucleotide Repeat-Containing 6B Protein [Manis pentadactyla]